MKYRHRFLVDSYDPRGIDVAILSRYPIMFVRSYREERNEANTGPLFSRDCLEAQIEVDGKRLFLYVNHFKSMIGGRDQTKKKRVEQATRVAQIIQDRWEQNSFEGNFVVLGDLNDYPDGDTSLKPLLTHPGLKNIVERMPKSEQWTHYFAGGDEYRQLDYLFLSKSLGAASTAVPGIMRKGLPYRADRYEGPRFDNVGESEPKASDHALVYLDLDLA